MHANEALQILGLRNDATQEEVKAAFRDMVKVWHPDRFGSDPRLREKAEQKLKDINDAYRVLRDGVAEARVLFPEPDASPPDSQAASDWAMHTQAKQRQTRLSAVLIYGFAGFFLIGLATYAYTLMRSVNQRARAALAAPSALATPASAANPVSGKLSDREPPKRRRGVSKPAAGVTAGSDFEVLTEAETAQVQAACAKKRRSGDAQMYSACMRAELARIRRYEIAGVGLSAEEQDSLASACANEKAQHDDPGYQRCVAFYKGELDTAPERPNMGALAQVDRDAAGAACAKSKSEGPASYDRCLMRFVRLLAKDR